MSTKIITGKVRLSYAHIWEPHAMEEGQKKKYSVSLIIPKSDKKTVDAINAAVKEAKEQGKSTWGGKIPANLKTPLRDGDEDRPDDENYTDCYFINANSDHKPGIFDRNNQKIIDPDEVYSGCYALASINFYPFSVSGNKGIACGLNGILKVSDGEPLGGAGSAEADFAELDLSEYEDDDILG